LTGSGVSSLDDEQTFAIADRPVDHDDKG